MIEFVFKMKYDDICDFKTNRPQIKEAFDAAIAECEYNG